MPTALGLLPPSPFERNSRLHRPLGDEELLRMCNHHASLVKQRAKGRVGLVCVMIPACRVSPCSTASPSPINPLPPPHPTPLLSFPSTPSPFSLHGVPFSLHGAALFHSHSSLLIPTSHPQRVGFPPSLTPLSLYLDRVPFVACSRRKAGVRRERGESCGWEDPATRRSSARTCGMR